MVPPLSFEEAARLADAFTRDLLGALEGLSAVRVALPGQPGDDVRRWLGNDVDLVSQGPGHLGERLERTFQRALGDSEEPVAIVGADHPNLPLDLVSGALRAAGPSSAGWIPTEDGGFALMALSEPSPGLFREVPWSTTAVAETIRENADREGIRLVEPGRWYDVDTFEDLRRLAADLKETGECPATRAVLSGIPALADPNPDVEGES